MTVTIEFGVDEPLPMFSTWRDGWKVVYCSLFGLISATDGAFATTYRPGLLTLRPVSCGPLTVFVTRYDATKFLYARAADLNETYRVFRCRYAPSVDRKVWSIVREPTLVMVPSGTDFADAVVLQ